MGKSLTFWNKYIQSQIPELELVKGNGYMYFTWSNKSGTISRMTSTPESIYVPYINQITKDMINMAIEETFELNPQILESNINAISNNFIVEMLFGD